MTDRLAQWANSPWTAPLVRALGLPQPRPLPRRHDRYDAREFAGRTALVLAAPGGFAADPCARWLGAQGADTAPVGAVQSLLVDATGCATADALAFLHHDLQPALARLAAGGRVLLLADAQARDPEAAACARAIDGFMRSLAKEIGRRGATANALSLAAGDVAALEGMLGFFCTDRSAYVSGQMLRLRGMPAAAASTTASRTAVVTGAAGGIGMATARRLAAEGLFVVCADIPHAAGDLQALATAIGGIALPLDITAPDAPRKLVEAVLPRGGVDVLVHNAGITRDRTFARMTDAEWQDVLDVNFRAVLALDGALDAAGALRGGGSEICLASISGLAGNAGQANYAASKAALIGYVAARAQALASRGVAVSAVAPGFIETAMTDRIPFMVRETGRRLNALLQGGRPEDVAEAIAFLARREARGLSGQALRVCGQSFLGA